MWIIKLIACAELHCSTVVTVHCHWDRGKLHPYFHYLAFNCLVLWLLNIQLQVPTWTSRTTTRKHTHALTKHKHTHPLTKHKHTDPLTKHKHTRTIYTYICSLNINAFLLVLLNFFLQFVTLLLYAIKCLL